MFLHSRSMHRTCMNLARAALHARVVLNRVKRLCRVGFRVVVARLLVSVRLAGTSSHVADAFTKCKPPVEDRTPTHRMAGCARLQSNSASIPLSRYYVKEALEGQVQLIATDRKYSASRRHRHVLSCGKLQPWKPVGVIVIIIIIIIITDTTITKPL